MAWRELAKRLGEKLRSQWRRALIIRDRLKFSEEAFHLLLAGGVGVLGGLAYYVFDQSHQLLTALMLRQTGDLATIAEHLEPWQHLLIPTLGGLGAGLILFLGLRLMGNPGLTNLLEVVVAGDGRLSLRTAIMNSLSSLVSISTGASVGREGLVIQLASTLASKIGVLAKWPPYRLRLLVACGAASGIAAACNAPIAGAVFAAQIVLGNFSMTLFAPLMFSSVMATILTRQLIGGEHRFAVNIAVEFDSLSQLSWFLLLGVMAGILGALFMKSLRVSGNFFNKTELPLYVRTALAGLILGLLALSYPEVWGNGYGATNRILNLDEPQTFPMFLVGLLAAKYLATVVTVGSGTVGGVFTPTLLLGAALGGMLSSTLHLLGWGQTLPIGAFALVGMGSMLAASTHSALLAIILVFELSLNYSLMPALMVACAVAMIVARSLEKESIYTEPLRRKGLDLGRESPHIGAATEKTVGDLMLPPVEPLLENTPFREIANRFLTAPNSFLPVVGANRRLVGVVALHDLKEYLNAGQELNSVIAYDIMRPLPPCLTPVQRLADILPILLSSELKNVPVVNNFRQFQLVGRVARAEALSLLSEVIAARSAPKL